jgi:hypothetical protein
VADGNDPVGLHVARYGHDPLRGRNAHKWLDREGSGAAGRTFAAAPNWLIVGDDTLMMAPAGLRRCDHHSGERWQPYQETGPNRGPVG